MFSESGFTHSDLLRGHNQYVGRSLKVNGAFYRDTYTITYVVSDMILCPFLILILFYVFEFSRVNLL
ncbi:TPA: hypothetical protein MHK28_26720 [Klebsiella pneumoniae]|nr:hypothetical protein [Klebsiella pneumoniae]